MLRNLKYKNKNVCKEWKHKQMEILLLKDLQQIKNPVDGLNSQLYRAVDKIRELDEIQNKILRFTEILILTFNFKSERDGIEFKK